MTNWSGSSAHVRCVRFKESGKWYDEFALDMTGFWHSNDYVTPIHAVAGALVKRFPGAKSEGGGFAYVVLDPYHEAAYPVLLHSDRIPDVLLDNVRWAARGK